MSRQGFFGSVVSSIVGSLIVLAILPVASLILSWFLNFSFELLLTLFNTALIISLFLWLILTRLLPKRKRVMQDLETEEIHLVEGNTRRHIPDLPTFNYLGALFGFAWSDVKKVSADEIARFSRESKLPSITNHCLSESTQDRDLKRVDYGIAISSSIKDKVFQGGAGNMTIDISGTYRLKPPLGTALRLFVRTEYGYWRQDAPVILDNDGTWSSKIGLWKAENDPGYDAYVIAAVLDEPGEDMVRYSKKVEEEGGVNISFWKLPHYLEKSEEVRIRRE